MPITLDGTNGITTPTYGGADTSEYLVPVTAFKNKLINGNMSIDQRNAGASVTVNNGSANFFITDRWFANGENTDGVFTGQQVSTAPTGFNNSIQFTVTTADASIGSGQAYTFRQRVEGYNIADLGWGTADAKTVTLSFWVRSSLTGTFGGSIFNSAGDRAYVFSYTISAANTWEYKTISIAGDTSGTWLTTNGTGLNLLFSLGSGSSLKGSAGSWGSTLFTAPTSSVDLIGTNGATFYITGVQLEVGSTATSFDYRPYGTELALCQRYYEKSYEIGTVAGTATQTGIIWTSQAQYTTTSYIGMSYTWKVQKRTAPTVTAYDKAGTSGTTTRWTLGSSETDGSNYSLSGVSDSTWEFFSSGSSNSAGLKLHFTASAEL